jgi:hypothetical protein
MSKIILPSSSNRWLVLPYAIFTLAFLRTDMGGRGKEIPLARRELTFVTSLPPLSRLRLRQPPLNEIAQCRRQPAQQREGERRADQFFRDCQAGLCLAPGREQFDGSRDKADPAAIGRRPHRIPGSHVQPVAQPLKTHLQHRMGVKCRCIQRDLRRQHNRHPALMRPWEQHKPSIVFRS